MAKVSRHVPIQYVAVRLPLQTSGATGDAGTEATEAQGVSGARGSVCTFWGI